MVLRIHYSVDQTELKAEIEEHGHEVINIFNVKDRRTKQPLPLFYIDLKPDANNVSIYKIEELQYTKVKFEEPHKKRTIPQCARCQRYGHTKTYCYRQGRCVKCGQNHLTTECTKPKHTDATCALCNGNHPANYKGCKVYTEIRNRKFQTIREKRNQPPTNTLASKEELQYPPQRKQQYQTRYRSQSESHPQSETQISQRAPRASYAQVTRNEKTETNNNHENLPKLNINSQLPTNIEHLLIRQLESQIKLSEDIRAMMNVITALINKLK